jgi:hypothetical protein
MRRADLADLTAFVAVADNLSFRAAASHIGVTPSALSRTDAAARGAPCGPASGTRCLGTASCRLRDPSPVPFRQNVIAFRDDPGAPAGFADRQFRRILEEADRQGVPFVVIDDPEGLFGGLWYDRRPASITA